MSHLTDVRLKVKDLDALGRAGGLLGFDLIEKPTYNWYGVMVGDSAEGRQVAAERGVESLGKCDYVLRRKNASQSDYEIGVVKDKDGAFSLLYDSWGSGQMLEQAAGKNLAKLRQEYSVAVAEARVTKTLARQGFRMTRENLAGGRVRLRLRKR